MRRRRFPRGSAATGCSRCSRVSRQHAFKSDRRARREATMDWPVCSGDTIRLSIGHERAAACSAVKATRFAGDPNKFGSALTASARCRNWLAVIDGLLGRLRLPLPKGRGHKVQHLIHRGTPLNPSLTTLIAHEHLSDERVGFARADQAGGARPGRCGRQFCAIDEHRTRLLPSSALLTAQVGQARLGVTRRGEAKRSSWRSEAEPA